MTIRWLTAGEFPEANAEIQQRGWAPLNEPTSRILGAFDGDTLVEVFVLQLYPLLGPLVRLDARYRDHGETSLALVDEMYEFLEQNDARSYLAICDHPATERLCQRFGMVRIEKPIFTTRAL